MVRRCKPVLMKRSRVLKDRKPTAAQIKRIHRRTEQVIRYGLGCTFGLWLATPAIANCPIAESVYRDVDGLEFELIFGEGLPDRAASRATVTINHPNQTGLYDFSMTQASGYGSGSLAKTDQPSKPATLSTSLTIRCDRPIRCFWDANKTPRPMPLSQA